ncbi:MAG TPA: FdtA/QdtA family cupin domain-containing protein [Myxococcota bacterium]|nr:FdtA/QdtA family cupin domain-containing protein [Myxococcota bacterium]
MNATAPHGARVLHLPTLTDPRGALTVLEAGKSVPFPIERVYYLHGVPLGAGRGGHAHRLLHQLLVAVSGSFVVTADDGHARHRHRLDRADRGLYLPPGLWREIDEFSPGAVCLTLASHPYDPSEYERDYDAFLASARAPR